MKKILLSLVFLSLASASHAGWNPPGWDKTASAEAEEGTGAGEAAAVGALKAYKSFVSPFGAGRCPSYPSCSSYSLRAIKLYGPLAGMMLTASRLVSEADEGGFSPAVFKGKWLIDNPPERDMAFLRGEK